MRPVDSAASLPAHSFCKAEPNPKGAIELRSPVDGPAQTLFSAQTLSLAHLPLSHPDRGRKSEQAKGESRKKAPNPVKGPMG